MKKLFKYLSLTLLSAAVLIVGTLFVLHDVLDPNRYRTPLQTLVAQQSGLDLQIAGDISWSLRPEFGLSLRDVRLRNPAARQELASFSEISLNLAPAALLRGEVLIQAIAARNLHLNWYADSEGQSNWFADLPPRGADTTGDAGADGDTAGLQIDLALISIENASLSVRDRQRGISLDLQQLQLESRDSNLHNRPFALNLRTRLVDNTSGRDLQLSLATQANVDMDAGNLALDALRLNLSPMQLDGELRVANFHQQAQWQLELASNTFNLLYLLENFIAIDAGDGVVLDQHQFNMRLSASGDERGATLNPMHINLDDSQLQLSADLLYPSEQRPLTLAYQLQANSLNLDPYLPSARSRDAGADGNSWDDELPFDALQGLNLRGEHQIGQLQLAGLMLEDANFSLLINDGELALQSEPMGFYGGIVSTGLLLDANAIPATASSRLTLQEVNLGALAESLPLLRAFSGENGDSGASGEMALLAEHQLRGDTANELLASISGSTHFNLQHGTVDITLIKRVFEAISVLSPRGEMGAGWPDVLDFSDASGQLLFTAGLADAQQLQAHIDNLSINGGGGIDLNTNRFDYHLQLTILGEPAPQSIGIHEDYQDVPWPVRCNASFDDSPVRYCSPELQQVRDLFRSLRQ